MCTSTLMIWMTFRLELAPTVDFPNGSASRAYLPRLPVDAHGMVDMAAFATNPGYATVRRHWPNQPDRSGYLLPRKGGWAFSYALDEGDAVFHLESAPMLPGNRIAIVEARGEILPFRIAGRAA